MVESAQLALMGVVALAFLLEAVVGFGATVLTVSLGALFLPLETLLPVFVPVNFALSLYLVSRHFRSAHVGLLVRRVLPFMLVGMAVGLFSSGLFERHLLLTVLGLFVVVMSTLQLVGLLSASGETPPPLPRRIAWPMLLIGGFIHGLFGSGGPMVVYVLAREGYEKATFRATLAVLWLVLNGLLIVDFVRQGRLNATTLGDSLLLVPPLLLGIAAGEWLFARVEARTFRLLMFSVLGLAGLSLTLRNAWKLWA
ncbi:MAG: sulfite exporter TauE/SafE family protein [Myxococcales bacterium]|nr:sulfite exporter TauE/SafE family protein [Myxococcales bacterium]